ncbi:H-NS histone family protein [Paraburkholderia phytofirmans]|uniref:Histone family protein nucleoid-structuring protein H-NS n=1 Tax=Paraburkholderia phytofirmans (strain DSM 17436 / LMG 22146 / PsJN) TaxID=398527 RepID=B2TGX2_PARPJ|nr:H-NS histone family protein [Paraburkholderia phytofirmans]ACD21688.1 histone family protein nucleoid-structuring protein H-NS [Paraburkholderia phytofirmans PsJN]
MNIEQLSYRELLAQRRALDEQIEQARTAERGEVIETIREKMSLYQITIAELQGDSPKRVKKPVEVRYRDPDSGSTWSGRGKPPRWIAGKDRASFQV